MTVTLTNKNAQGQVLKAVYAPEKGLNLNSYSCNGVEAIAQSTRPMFEERFGGLGALIGPHFYKRKPALIPKVKDESLFPHIAAMKAKNSSDPFTHGLGRYAPWKVETTENSIKGTLSGKDLWNGVPLAELEGQNFIMTYKGELTPEGLKIGMSVVSDADSIVGIHYYYNLPGGRGKVISRVQDKYYDPNVLKNVPKEWIKEGKLVFDLNNEADYAFHPAPDPLKGHIELETETHKLITAYTCLSQENAWQLYHPAGTDFVCIEPVSAQDPRHPNLTVSSISILITLVV